MYFDTDMFAIAVLLIGMTWIILHYVSRWKTQPTLTKEDENLLDDLYELSRRLEERITTVERILNADSPGWRALSHDPASIGIDDEISAKRKMT